MSWSWSGKYVKGLGLGIRQLKSLYEEEFVWVFLLSGRGFGPG